VICAPSTFGNFHFTTWYFLGFSLYRPALWGFPLYHSLDGKMSLSNASTAIENQTFSTIADVTKNILIFFELFIGV